DVSLTLDEPGRTSIQNHWRGVVETIEPDRHPSQVRVRVRCGEDVLLARITRRSLDQLALRADSVVWAQVKSVALVRCGPAPACDEPAAGADCPRTLPGGNADGRCPVSDARSAARTND